MQENNVLQKTNWFECSECSNRFADDGEVSECEYCGTMCGVNAHLEPIPKNSVRVYCADCDFQVDIDKDEHHFPLKLARGRANIHESQGHHRTHVFGSGEVHGVNDKGMDLCGQLDSEDELQEWLEGHFENNGWTAIREVSPRKSNYKADLIVKNDEYGWVGIETKYFDGDGGAKVAKAHHQITRKYRGERYIGNRINLWAFCPYFKSLNSDSRMHSRKQEFRSRFSRELFCKHGIGYIDLDRRELLIDFAYSQPIAKIPVSDESYDRYYDNVDIDEIEKSVRNKMREYDYK